MKKCLPAAVVALLIVGFMPFAHAEYILLTDGSSYEGTIAVKGEEYEVATKNGTIWIEKSKVKRIVKKIEELTDEATHLVDDAQKLYDAAKKISIAKEANDNLHMAVGMLEKARSIYFDTRDIFSTPEYKYIDGEIRKVIQLIKMCRDSSVRESGPSSKAAEPQPIKPADAPDNAKPVGGEPLTPPKPDPIAPAPSSNVIVEELRKLIAEKNVAKALGKYGDARKMGEDVDGVRETLAAIVFDYAKGIAKKDPKKGIEFIRKSAQLDPKNMECKEWLCEGLITAAGGPATTKNASIIYATEVIEMVAELRERKPGEAQYINYEAQAYYARGYKTADKFSWKETSSQPRKDLETASELFKKVIQTGVGGQMAANAKTRIANIEDNLRKLSGKGR